MRECHYGSGITAEISGSHNEKLESAAPLEFFFQEQSYSSLHSGLSLAWDHVRADIDDPCDAIADFCGVRRSLWRCRDP